MQGGLDRFSQFRQDVCGGCQQTEASGDHHVAKRNREVGTEDGRPWTMVGGFGLRSIVHGCKHRTPRPGHDQIKFIVSHFKRFLAIDQRAVAHVVEDVFVFERAIC